MMFFYLSKIFWLAAQPLNLAILLLLVAVAAGLSGRRRISVRLSGCAFLILALSSWTALGAWMISPLEERFARPQLPDRVDGIIVLGGGFESAINIVRGGYELNGSGDRFVEAAILARRFPTARIVVSGGNPALAVDEEPDATTAPRLLTALGVAPERLVLEGKSRNTYENAIFTKALIAPKTAGTWILVTSAFHMPRAKAAFDKAGFPVIPWPVDYRSTGREGLGLLARNPIDALRTTTYAVHEWIGLLAYWLTGRIDSPFPVPGPRL
jgi:uncharacterized SAM-binding protein YcdF (DUF218 family)